MQKTVLCLDLPRKVCYNPIEQNAPNGQKCKVGAVNCTFTYCFCNTIFALNSPMDQNPSGNFLMAAIEKQCGYMLKCAILVCI